MTATVSAFAFYVLAALIIVGAIGMLVSKNIMHSAYWLLELAIVSAAIFFLLDARYLALVQLLVYAGAVSILLIFSIMITTRGRVDAHRPRDLKRTPLFIALAMVVLLVVVINGLRFPQAIMPDSIPSLVEFGKILFNPHGWALPFEIASLILTVGLVGAVWWAGKEEK